MTRADIISVGRACGVRRRVERRRGRALGGVFNAVDARESSRVHGYRYGHACRYGYRGHRPGVKPGSTGPASAASVSSARAASGPGGGGRAN